jgi:hypothetical protein
MIQKWICGLFALVSVITLIGCEVILDHLESSARFAEPPQITRTVKRIKCGPNCSDVIVAAKLDPTRARTTTFKQIADRPNMTAHEQIHLINTIADLEYGLQHPHWQPEDVVKVLTLNPTLTLSAKRYLADNIDQISMTDDKQRDIIKKLTGNKGVADPAEAGVVEIEYTLDDIEVIFCDYYQFDYQIVAELRERGCRADEVTVLLFLGYYSKHSPLSIVRWYTIPRLQWSQIAYTKLRLEPKIFFVDATQTEEFGAPYGRAYGRYRNNPNEVELSNEEAVDLVQLKGLSETYNIPPTEIINAQNQGRDLRQQAKNYRRTMGKPKHSWRD